MSKIVAVTNQKGGVGKTTTTVNLSACLAEAGKRVLLVDADPQGNASSGLGRPGDPGKTLYQVLIEGLEAREAIVATATPGLFLLPASIEMAGAEIELVSMPGREAMLKRALESIRSDYDYLLIDCPPSLGLLTLNALTAADSVLVPIQCEYYALEGVGQLMNTLNLVRKRLNPELMVEGVLLTMLDGRTNLGLQVVDEVKKHFRDRVFSTIVPRNVRLGEAPSHGLPIHLYDARCPGTTAYRELAAEVIDRNEGDDW
ncbi:ParA family protein [Bacillota bacterium Meth-B3]|nr:AAA family ATPase [Christensenellaceae bacterium]MEA5069288.1 AAA family ATPase [Christensenellaceae bacterium]